MSRAKYRWSNARFSALVPANVFGRWLKKLPDTNPATIVDHAANPRSPAHGLFNWDDSTAAREYRLVQARVILGSFVIETEVTTKGREPRNIEVPFVSRSAPGLYEITTRAMRSPDKRDFILRSALAELKRFRSRYANLSELALVFAAMDEVETRAVRKRA
jgi:hypothetical protein